ncbi:MAG: sterol desaturase family protein [Saprospiraceae bacterium]|nr:sterol desaturase family protein [Saprospiraceae bacterium]
MRAEMATYGLILMYVIPVFFILVIGEKLYGWYWKKEPFKMMDMISSLSSGFSNAVKDSLGLVVVILSYGYMVDHWAIMRLESSLAMYIVAFIVIDFYGYWTHRIAHTLNIFWNKHAIHHSSEEFNLACALRQSISVFVNLFTFLLLPAALFGVPAKVVAIVAPIQLFMQFWYHTTYIGKMGFLEKILVTPSHHRVHHAINPVYLDKNHSQIFIIWDKLFGTFQEELPDVPPVYGITRPVKTWNPIKINFLHLWLLIKDAWRAENWMDKLTIWFKPLGWRPADVAAKYPVEKIEDPYHFQKYETPASNTFITWICVQGLVTLAMMYHLFANLATIPAPWVFIYGGYIMLSIYAYTELMDRNPNAVWWDALKAVVAVGLMYVSGSWFGAGQSVSIIMAVYLLISMAVTYYFSHYDKGDVFETLKIS